MTGCIEYVVMSLKSFNSISELLLKNAAFGTIF